MKIKTLEQMELIVSSNKNLSWDGWDVVNYTRSEKARTSKYGKFINGNWYLVKTFKLGKNGWDIPDGIMANAQAKMER
jgi:hypothetical protein